jgi:hypothetical protein
MWQVCVFVFCLLRAPKPIDFGYFFLGCLLVVAADWAATAVVAVAEL